MPPDLRSFLVFLAVVAGLFALLFGVLVTTGAVIAVEQAIATVASGFMTALSPADVFREVLVRPRASQLEYHLLVVSRGERHAAAGLHPLHAQNLVLFAALVLGTPRLRLRTRAQALLAGLLGVFAIDVVFVMGDLWRIEMQFIPEVRDRIEFPGALFLATYVPRLHPTGAIFFLLPFLWGLFLLGPLRPAGRARPPRRRASA